jgi:hypothetical protein
VQKLEETRGLLIERLNKVRDWATRLLQNMARKENYLNELHQQTDEHLRNFKHLRLQMKAFLFSGDLMTFTENTDEQGKIIQEPIGFMEIQKLKMPTLIEQHLKKDESPSTSNLTDSFFK